VFDRSRTRFHDKNLQKRGTTFSLRSFERTIRATVPQLAWQEQVTFFYFIMKCWWCLFFTRQKLDINWSRLLRSAILSLWYSRFEVTWLLRDHFNSKACVRFVYMKSLTAILSLWYSRFEVTWLLRDHSKRKTRVQFVYVLPEVLHGDFLPKIKYLVNLEWTKVFDRVKSVALWSANIRKMAKDHKGYGSAAIMLHA
jgi:hypothetical protein